MSAAIISIQPEQFVPVVSFSALPLGGTIVNLAMVVGGLAFKKVNVQGASFNYLATQAVPQFLPDWVMTSETPAICSVSGNTITRVAYGLGLIRFSSPSGFSTTYSLDFTSQDSFKYVWTGFSGVTKSSLLAQPILNLLLPGKQKDYFARHYQSGDVTMVRNPACWAAPLDITFSAVSTALGGGSDSYNSGALITPQHWMGVAHWGSGDNNMGPGARLGFAGSDGVIHFRTVLRRHYSGSPDQIVCLLDSPLPATVKPIKLAGAGMFDFPNARAWGMGWQITHEKFVTPISFDELVPGSRMVAPTHISWFGRFSEFQAAGYDLDPDHRMYPHRHLLQQGRAGDSGGAVGGYYNGETCLVSLFTSPSLGNIYDSRKAPVLNTIISELDAAQGIATGYTVGVLSMGFNPSMLANLWAWYDATDTATLYDATTGGALVALGAPVARLVDKSGNGRHLVQSNATKRPLRSAFGIASDNVNDRLEAARPRTNAYTLCARVKLSVIANETRFFCVNYCYFGIPADGKLAVLNELVSWGYSQTTPTMNSVVTVTILRSSASNVELRVNGVGIASITTGQAADADAFLAILEGEYGRIVLADSVVAGAQLTDLENFVSGI